MRANASRNVQAGQCTRPKEMIGKNLEDLSKDDMSCKYSIESVCAADGEYCPVGCSCQDTVVRCSNKDLQAFPTSIPFGTTELFLDSNSIDEILAHQIGRLTNLVKLDLSHNRIESIEDNTFANLTKLSTLILSYNKLRCLQPNAFSGLRSLRILSLHGNDISLLPETAFASLSNITHIAVGSNSLYCDCRMEWFSRWIKSKFVEAGIARCHAPAAVANQLLLTARSHQFRCEGSIPAVVAAKCDACITQPCKNGARCDTISGRDYRCICTAGYHGKNCEREIDACFGHPCLNNAVCKVIQEGRFKCVCPKGFKGDYCETNIDDCEKNKCQNGAKCIDMVNSYKCQCGPMFAGKYCEEKLEYCSKRLNPCRNGANCKTDGSGYKCECLPGFTGQNCSTNIDDCGNHQCQNGAICVDGITTYSCKCVMGFSGEFCDIPPLSNALHPKTSQCNSLSCGHGSCYTNEEMSEYECRCHEGYTGEKCDRIRAIGFEQPSAYVALEPWAVENGNLTFTIRTTNRSGMIAYYGDKSFLSAELYDGRIKIAFYIGNYPTSHMYSFVTVNDGLPHRIEILVQGKKCSLSVDSLAVQSIENDGKLELFALETKQYLYIGGLPPDRAARVKESFHVKESNSFTGCISDVFVNEVAVDFENAVEKERVTVGCAHVVDLCAGVITCNKEKYRRYHVEGDCRSVDMVKNAECVGFCGDGEHDCCAAIKTKRRTLKMLCRNGQTYEDDCSNHRSEMSVPEHLSCKNLSIYIEESIKLDFFHGEFGFELKETAIKATC
ncbi:EGF-like domain protein, partial [Ostertagia ostertagi]